MRHLLSSFYSPDPSSTNDSPSNHGSLDAIKTTTFNADQYMNLLIRKSNLEALRQRHVEMAAEIKNIDTDLQVLVYENYNKFISTTDAVKRKIFDVVATVVCSIKLSGLLKFVHKHCFLYWNFDFNRMKVIL
ncbi:hypothetical protein GOBAR_DD12149 [Gossypium barbadense]|nr:hypothetical protein GOBAR_DD12149 [Gossypium barbadense]